MTATSYKQLRFADYLGVRTKKCFHGLCFVCAGFRDLVLGPERARKCCFLSEEECFHQPAHLLWPGPVSLLCLILFRLITFSIMCLRQNCQTSDATRFFMRVCSWPLLSGREDFCWAETQKEWCRSGTRTRFHLLVMRNFFNLCSGSGRTGTARTASGDTVEHLPAPKAVFHFLLSEYLNREFSSCITWASLSNCTAILLFIQTARSITQTFVREECSPLQKQKPPTRERKWAIGGNSSPSVESAVLIVLLHCTTAMQTNYPKYFGRRKWL